MILSNLFWKFSERILAQGVSFIVTLILARILLPEEFGIVALVIIFIDVANALVTSGFNTSLIREKNADELDFSSVFWFGLVFSILVYVLIYVGAVPFSKFYKMDMIVPVFRVMGIRIVISSLNSVQHAYVARNLLFKKYFISTFFGTAFSAFAGIYLALNGYGVWALVCQYLINTIIDTIVLLFTVDWKPKLMFSFERIRTLFSFGWKIMVDSLSSILQFNLRNFLIGKFYTAADLAYYTKAQSIPSLFLNNIGVSISSVLLPTMSNVSDDKEKIVNYLRKANKLETFIIYPMLVGVILVAKEFVEIVLTSKWLPMVPYLQLHCLTCMTMILMPSRNDALKSIGRSDVLLKENTMVRIIDILFVVALISKTPYILMLSQFVTYVICLCLVVYNASVYNGYDYKLQFDDIKNSLIGCVFMILIIRIISYINLGCLSMLLLKIAVGAITYMAVSYLFHFDELTIVLNIVRKFFNAFGSKHNML